MSTRAMGRAEAMALLHDGWEIVRVSGRFGGWSISKREPWESRSIRADTACKLAWSKDCEQVSGQFGVQRYRLRKGDP